MTSVSLNSAVVEEVVRLTGAATKRAGVEAAMREFVNQRRRESLVAMFGDTDLDMTPDELQRWRRSSIRRYQ